MTSEDHLVLALLGGSTITHLLDSYGYWVVVLFVTAESLGVPLPGETALIAAGIYAGTTHRLSVMVIFVVASVSAIMGDNIGYVLGRVGGVRLLRRYGRYVGFDEAKLKVGRYVFQRRGGLLVFFGRFVSVLRTYAAFLAGTNKMSWLAFVGYNATGGILWAALYSFGSWSLGEQVDRLSATIDYTLGAAAGLAIAGLVVFVRRKGKKLQERAEQAFPGPL